MKNTVLTAGIVAVVPAAGIGSRMQATCPKQYLKISGKTLLEHSIDSLLSHPKVSQVIVALHPNDTFFQQLPAASDPRILSVVGGETRAESVLAGLKAIDDHSTHWVLVHDAARPCLTAGDLDKLLAVMDSSEIGGILATPVKDTMKRATTDMSVIDHSVARTDLWHALTPQLFPVALLKKSLCAALSQGKEITDEASALEYLGYHPILIDGRSDNIKVTRPEDLALAEFYLNHSKQ